MFAFGQVSQADERLFRCCQDTFEQALRLLRPNSQPADIASQLSTSFSSWGYQAGIWGGHGIGLDVLEQPRLLPTDSTLLQQGMAFGFHPHVVDSATNRGAYLADTLLVTPQGGVGLSAIPRELHVIP
jgi:Xaa-Pro aminopeptidase